MIARPPEKKFSSKTTSHSRRFVKVANDNRPPKRIFLGWVVILTGILLLLGAGFWIYENTILYYQDATQWWTDEQSLDKHRQGRISTSSPDRSKGR